MFGRLVGIGLAALLGVAVGACATRSAPPLPRRGEWRGANVLLVTIDTLRRDRVGAYGSALGLTPTLDAAARDGLRFSRAYSHAPMTLPAHTSIFTGLIPPHHGVRANGTFRLDDHVPTLATVLKGAGYRTGAFVGAFVLDARFGLNRGFDEYDDRYRQQPSATSFAYVRRPASEVVDAAERWIARPAAGPWFAWIHLYDPHAPYEAPPAFRSNRAPYDAAVAYADATLGALFDRLRRAGALERAVVVLTSDHGESLGDHGESTHGLFAYDSTLAVPLIVSAPGIRPGVVETPIGHADLVPTILGMLDIAPPPLLDGKWIGDAAADRAIYFEALDANLTRDWAPLAGVVRRGWKYIRLPLPELYDTNRDPAEAHNLADADKSTVDVLARLLEQQDTRSLEAGRSTAPSPGRRDVEPQLRALGYVAGSGAQHRRSYGAADDPKQLVALNERFTSAIGEFNKGQSAAALQALLGILAARNDFLSARTSAASILLEQGRPREAAALIDAAPADQRDAPALLAKRGVALREAGDLRGAAQALEAARRRDSDPDLFNDLGVVYARQGRYAEARSMFESLLAGAPDAAGTWYNLGLLELDRRDAAAAAKAFRRAVEADASYGEAWVALGATLAGSDRGGAIDAWRHAERLLPRDYDLLYNLGTILADTGDAAAAVPLLERFVREAPRDKYAADLPRVRARLERLERQR